MKITPPSYDIGSSLVDLPNLPDDQTFVRDYFAGQALVGLLSQYHIDRGYEPYIPSDLANDAYLIAKHMLRVRFETLLDQVEDVE